MEESTPPLKLLAKHSFNGGVESLAYSMDGKYLASGGHDRKVSIIDTLTNEIIKQHQFDSFVRAVAYSPNSDLLVVGGYDQKVTFLTTPNHEPSNTQPPIKMKDNENTISFSKDGRNLFVGGRRYFNILKKQQDGRYKSTKTEEFNDQFVLSSSFSHNNNNIVAFNVGSTVYIRNIDTDTILNTYQQNNNVFALQFSPDDKHLAIGGNDKKFKIYDTSTSSLVYQHDHESIIYSICYSTTNNVIIVGDGSGNVTFYDIENPQRIVYKMKIKYGPIRSIAESPPQQDQQTPQIAISSGKKIMMYETMPSLRNHTVKEEKQSGQKMINDNPEGDDDHTVKEFGQNMMNDSPEGDDDHTVKEFGQNMMNDSPEGDDDHTVKEFGQNMMNDSPEGDDDHTVKEFGQKMMNDNPEGDDDLDLSAEAEAFATYLSSKDLKPPFVLGILGKFFSSSSRY